MKFDYADSVDIYISKDNDNFTRAKELKKGDTIHVSGIAYKIIFVNHVMDLSDMVTIEIMANVTE